MVDNIVKIFRSTDTSFVNNGIGILQDVISCIVKEERNGSFELEMSYPVNGRYYDEIELRKILVAKPNPYSSPQPFRIYRIDKVINGIITVGAQHISYDLSGYPLHPFEAENKREAFELLKSESVMPHPFNFWYEGESDATFLVPSPRSTRSALGGEEGSILDVYKGEYEFDNYEIKLWKERGKDNGVLIRYGKNLTDFDQEENCANVYTGVYPFWFSEGEEESILVELDGQSYIEAEGEYDFVRLYPLDLSDKFVEEPTDEQLREEAISFMKENKIGIPKVSMTVSFIELTKFSEYKNLSLLEQVHLCDIVSVEFPKMQVSAKAKCISTTYNVITNRYDEIVLGDEPIDLATTIVENGQNLNTLNQSSANTQINQRYTRRLLDRNTESIEKNTQSINENRMRLQKFSEDTDQKFDDLSGDTDTKIGQVNQSINQLSENTDSKIQQVNQSINQLSQNINGEITTIKKSIVDMSSKLASLEQAIGSLSESNELLKKMIQAINFDLPYRMSFNGTIMTIEDHNRD